MTRPAPADASPAGDPTYTDDLELRYAEVCEERDHLRRALAKPAAPVAKFDMGEVEKILRSDGSSADVLRALVTYLRQFARRDGEAG